MDEPNGMVAIELLIIAIAFGNGALGLLKGGLWLHRRPVFRTDEPGPWRRAIVNSFGFAALLTLHLAAVAVTRLRS